MREYTPFKLFLGDCGAGTRKLEIPFWSVTSFPPIHTCTEITLLHLKMEVVALTLHKGCFVIKQNSQNKYAKEFPLAS